MQQTGIEHRCAHAVWLYSLYIVCCFSIVCTDIALPMSVDMSAVLHLCLHFVHAGCFPSAARSSVYGLPAHVIQSLKLLTR